MYTITLRNGEKLQNLELNGNNFVANDVLEKSVFDGKLGTVTISNGTEEQVYTDMVLLSHRVEDGRSWFVLGKKTQQDKAMERLANMETTTDDLVLMLAEIIGG